MNNPNYSRNKITEIYRHRGKNFSTEDLKFSK